MFFRTIAAAYLTAATVLVTASALPPHPPPPPPPGPPGPPGHPKPPAPIKKLSQQVIYQPASGQRALYPRHVELDDGTLLVTSSVRGLSDSTGSVFPVFESKDFGQSWKWVSNISDQVNGWGMPAQPALMELREPLGGFQPGTILASGNSWSNNGTRIDLYASTDKARSWKFVSHVAQGGRPNTTNGADPVWEPYLMVYNHKLVCYYSDQRDKLHGQKLAHQTSKDLKTWGPVVNDVRYDEYLARPGMTVIAKIEPLNKYILVHEFPVGNSSSHGSHYPVYYRIADSPLEFDKAEGLPIVITYKNGTEFAPNASPYVVWSPVGGPLGTIIVSDADYSQVYTNRFGGAVDKWEAHETPQPAAYSRALHIFEKNRNYLAVIGGATFDAGGPDGLSLSVVKVDELIKN